MKKFLFGLVILAAAAMAPAAFAGNTVVFSSVQGDVILPISPPTNAGATPGALDNTTVGATTPATGSFTTAATSGLATLNSVKVDTGTKTATATGTTTATATLDKNSGKVTSASLTTAAGATYVLTLTSSAIAAADQVYVSVATAGTGTPSVTHVEPGVGSVVINIQNIHASAAFNNTIVISYFVVKA